MSALKLEKMTRSFVLASTTSVMMARMMMIVIVIVIVLASTTSRIESTKVFGSNCRP